MAHDSTQPIPPPSPLAGYAGKRRNTLTALLVATAFFMENLDGTVITTAVPSMAKDFGVIPADLGDSQRPFDWKGFFWTGSGLASVMWAVELCGRPVLSWDDIVLYLGAGMSFLHLGIRHLKNHPHPMLSLEPIKRHSYAINIWGGALFRMSVGAVPFLLPLMFQVAYGMNAFQAGQLVLVVFAGNLAMKLFTTPVMKRFGFRRILLCNGVFNTLALAACALIGPEMSFMTTAVILFIGGLSRSMQFTALNTLAFAEMPQEDLSAASSLFSTTSQLALGSGIALGAIAIRIGQWTVPLLALDHVPGAAYRLAFLVVALVSLAGMVDLLGLKRDAGSSLTGIRGTAK